MQNESIHGRTRPATSVFHCGWHRLFQRLERPKGFLLGTELALSPRQNIDRLGLHERLIERGTEIDPLRNGRDLFRIELLAILRHARLLLMRDQPDEQTLVASSNHRRRSALAPLEKPFLRGEVQLPFGRVAAVASDALVLQDRSHIRFEDLQPQLPLRRMIGIDGRSRSRLIGRSQK